MDATRTLARTLYRELSPNTSLTAIENRVWMLKQRNMPAGTIREILTAEYGEPVRAEGASIRVHSLPDAYQRTDWR